MGPRFFKKRGREKRKKKGKKALKDIFEMTGKSEHSPHIKYFYCLILTFLECANDTVVMEENVLILRRHMQLYHEYHDVRI